MVVAKFFIQTSLHEEVGIPLPVFVAEFAGFFPHEGAGIPALGIVEIELHPPVSVGDLPVEAVFHAEGAHVAVLADGRGVVAVEPAVGELVFARGVEVFRADGVGDLAAQFLLPEEGRIHRAEGAPGEGCLEVGALPAHEHGCAALEIHGACRRIVLGRLHGRAFLAVVERHRLHILERVLSQVDLAVLGVAQLDAVVEHAHVVGTHTADVDGLQAADAAVVLDLDAGEIADGVGHGQGVEPFKFFALQRLRGDDLLRLPECGHDRLVQDLRRVGRRRQREQKQQPQDHLTRL